MKARNYCVIEGKLFRRDLMEPLLRCISPEETKIVIDEVHLGICGEHLAGKNMALKIIRHGVFWPTMRQDCERYLKHCKACQVYSSMNHMPSVPILHVGY